MAIRDINQAIEAIAEKIKGIERRLEQMSNQRRTQVVDLFGIEVVGTSNVDKTEAYYPISISPDMVYIERFQFKVFQIEGINARNFKVYIKRAVDNEYIDITQYLIYQTEQIGGSFMGDGKDKEYYPKTAISGDDNVNGSFDLIDVSNSLYDNDEDENAERIIDGGIKEIKITASSAFTSSLLLYLKYSHLNR